LLLVAVRVAEALVEMADALEEQAAVAEEALLLMEFQ
jgi:hypothetical protein